MGVLRIGLVGAAGRPTAFLDAFKGSGRATLAAACDLDADKMAKALDGLPDTLRFSNYSEMLDTARLDAVIIGTPIPLHVAQAVSALERNIAVYSEIPLGEGVEELKNLRRAVRRSKAMFMTGENVVFFREYMALARMVEEGVFGEILYAEGEYLHDCRELIEKTPWRKKCLYETAGLTYGTHCLGPILRWFPGDRVTRVCCAGSGRGTDEALLGDNATVMLCKTEKGRLIKIRQDISSPHPYALNFALQGTKAAYQSSHQGEDRATHQIFFEDQQEKNVWQNFLDYEEKYLPELWKRDGVRGGKGAHGGADTAAMTVFIDALYMGTPSPIGIDEGLDMTLPGVVSRASIAAGGVWVDVPDPRTWKDE